MTAHSLNCCLENGGHFNWFTVQRKNYRKNKLSKEDIEAFERLLGSVWYPRNEYWDKCFEAYKEYVKLTGRQPAAHTNHNGINIGLWLSRFRQDSDSLSPEQIARLNATGMRWIRDPLDPSSKLSPAQERKRLAHDARQERKRLERLSHQSDDEWFTYYYRYKEFISSLPENPDSPQQENGSSVHDEQGLKIWLNIQRELALENKLPENRTRSLGLLTQYIMDSRLAAKKYDSGDSDE